MKISLFKEIFMKTRWIALIMLLALALAGCGQGGDLTPGEPQVPPSQDDSAGPPENPPSDSTKPVEVTPLASPTPESSEQEDTSPMPNLSDPDFQKLVQTATEDLAKRFSISADQIEFKEATEVVWPDSSLGCPNPSSMYMQVLTPGYLIRLQTPDKMFEYHTDKKGSVIYCENPSPLPLDSLPKE
jgi:hypothetical protein